MPSGHGAGRGGSHFRGSSSRSSGGSHFGGGSRHIGRSRIYHRGGRVVVANRSGSIIACLVVVFIAVILFFAGFSSLKDINKDLQHIRNQRKYYFEMIDSGYRTTAKVTGCHYEFGKYYITYEFTNDAGRIEGYSFCVYDSYSKAPDYGSAIEIAYDSKTDIEADSIPIDYKNYKLSDDGEYLQIKDQKFTGYIFIFIGGAMILVMIFVVVRRIRLAKLEEEFIAESKANQFGSSTNNKKICSYCGTILNGDKCPSCGSSDYEKR